MRKLAEGIADVMVDEYGAERFLQRLSDPFWFQAFGCVLAYDWHSSGVTTVVTGVLKNALSPQRHGIAVCGGKGKTSRKTPGDIEAACEAFDFPQSTIDELIYSSRMAAKVDNAAVQAGYQLYHHAFLVTSDAKWAVVQQGLSEQERSARRYHWLSDNTRSFVVEPHTAVVGTKHSQVLNMVADKSEKARNASVDAAKEPPKKLIRLIESASRSPDQSSLAQWLPASQDPWRMTQTALNMPRNINWDTLERLYDFQPDNYEELLAVKGVGPATVRGLALVAELVYGEEPSWEDPVKFSFAYGGKDGVPYPVNRQAMDESISILRDAVSRANVGDSEKLQSLQRLRSYVPPNANS